MEYQFAYGSNMDSNRLKQKEGIEHILNNARRARLNNWEFGFTKKGKDGGKANIIRNDGRIVWGLLIQLTPKEVEIMDRSEGTGTRIPHYVKESIEVTTDDGIQHECKVYIANSHPERFDERGVHPSKEYLQHILDGAHEHNLPEEYVRLLQSLGTN